MPNAMTLEQSARYGKARHVRRGLIVVIVIAVVLLLGRGWAAQRRFLSQVQGQLAADFELTALDGDTVRVADYRGKPVVLAFWAVG